MHPAGDQVIARAFRGRSSHERGLDFKKTLVRQALPHRPGDLVAEFEIPLHLLPAQIDVAIFQAQLFVGDGLFGRRKRRHPGVVQHQQLLGGDLDFAGRHLGVDHILAAQANRAHHGHHVFRPHLFGLGVAFRGQIFVEHDLRDPGAVTQVQEDQVAVVAAPVHPSHEDDLFAGVLRAELSTSVRALKSA